MSELVETVLKLLSEQAPAERWAPVLSPDVKFEALRISEKGRDTVAARLGGGNYADLTWARMDRPGVVLFGDPGEARDRGFAVTLEEKDGLITSFSQQGVVVPRSGKGSPMAMDAALRDRFDRALEHGHAMSLCYVDQKGAPHISMRGSIKTLGPDSLGLWARAGSGLTEAVKHNPNVALMFRDPGARATYQIAGRARVAEDEATRKLIYDLSPEIEQRHDFALIGAAIVIDLDLIEGWAGFNAAGQIDPIRLVRER
jgi:hypothetical protein